MEIELSGRKSSNEVGLKAVPSLEPGVESEEAAVPSLGVCQQPRQRGHQEGGQRGQQPLAAVVKLVLPSWRER